MERDKFTIRTSDRRVFRRCPRKWNYQSSLRCSLKKEGAETNINFWFGSGIHFALEDYHGYNLFKDPRRAFHAYYNAFKTPDLPTGAESGYILGMAMLSYYLNWIDRHNRNTKFETAWLDDNMNLVAPNTPGAHPAVEQSFLIPLNLWVVMRVDNNKVIGKQESAEDLRGVIHQRVDENGPYDVKYIPLFYHGTIDKLMVDVYGRVWLTDYKTAKGADTNKLDTDDQVSAYLWAAQYVFPFPIYGFVYLQLTKDMVQEPKRLKSGELSVDKKQKTTYGLVKQEIINDYGSVSDAPAKMIEFLNTMADKESPEGDRFIRWDFIKRSTEQLQATERHIYGEISSMLSSSFYPFPSPTRDCSWDCDFRDICINSDKGATDEVEVLLSSYKERTPEEEGNNDPWRASIKYPVEGEAEIPMEDILSYQDMIRIEMTEHSEESPFAAYDTEEEC